MHAASSVLIQEPLALKFQECYCSRTNASYSRGDLLESVDFSTLFPILIYRSHRIELRKDPFRSGA